MNVFSLPYENVNTNGIILPNPASSTLMELFHCNNRSRREDESLWQFFAALRGLASACAFGDQLDSLLQDCFVCGINNAAMQTRLLLHIVAEDLPVFNMWHTGLVPSSVPPYTLTEVCGCPISMELDKASVSVMAKKLFKRTFPGVSIEASSIMLRSYSGKLSQVQG
ncbi:hypothetical protein HPB52_001176 [Rhipicephalus sanguineus]|uniref:Uncharacterized protein n=1 Tax=Rhipicephalus sanguineus TaxID=34632 RepID=A0A9D4QHT2_RHISA|nr:hypothetical protein HPB52_001176 [Rhipicephalus sanguineus]